MNCKTCGYKYCPFHGVDREIPAYLCEDYKPAEDGTDIQKRFLQNWHEEGE